MAATGRGGRAPTCAPASLGKKEALTSPRRQGPFRRGRDVSRAAVTSLAGRGEGGGGVARPREPLT